MSSMSRRHSTHTHRLRLQTMSQKITRPIAAKYLRFFFQFLVWCFGSISSQTRTVNSTQRHYKTFPFTRVSHDAHQYGYHPVTINFFMIVKAKVLSKAWFAEKVLVIILNLNFFSRKHGKPIFVCNAISRTWPTSDTKEHFNCFQFIQRMNSNLQSINHFNLRLVYEYKQLWFAIDLYL